MTAVARPTILKTDEYRWSSAVKCPRWAVLERRQADARPRSTREQGIFARGRLFEDYVARQIAEKYGPDQVQAREYGGQREVVWPGGILHVDIHVVPERTSLEVKSSTSPAGLLDDAILQVAGPLRFDDATDAAALVLVNPVDMAEQLLPVQLTDALNARVDDLLDRIQTAEQSGGIPDCVCDSPTGCRFKGCPFTDAAWQGWTAPDPVALDGETAALVTELYEARRERDEHKGMTEIADKAYREVCARLAEKGIQAGCDYMAGPLKLRRVTVNGRESFSLTRARKTGVWTDEHDALFGPFLTLGDPHDRWSVDRVGDGPLEVHDPGEVPF